MKIKEITHLFEDIEFTYEDRDLTIRCSGPYKDTDGIFYYKDGLYHRDDGPAMVWNDGRCAWFLEDEVIYNSENQSYMGHHEDKVFTKEFKQSIIKYRLRTT
jgi:hypothetical protein